MKLYDVLGTMLSVLSMNQINTIDRRFHSDKVSWSHKFADRNQLFEIVLTHNSRKMNISGIFLENTIQITFRALNISKNETRRLFTLPGRFIMILATLHFQCF